MAETNLTNQLQQIDEQSFDFWFHEMKHAIKENLPKELEISRVNIIRFFRGDTKHSKFPQIEIDPYHRQVVQFIIDVEGNSNLEIVDQIRLALCHLVIGDYYRAYHYLVNLQNQEDLPPEFHFAFAMCNIHFKRFDISIHHFEKSEISDDPIIKFDSIFFKAYAFSQMKNLKAAIDQISILLQSEFNHPQFSQEDIQYFLASISYLDPEFNETAEQLFFELETKNSDLINLQKAYCCIISDKLHDSLIFLNQISYDTQFQSERTLYTAFCLYSFEDFPAAYQTVRPLLQIDQLNWALWAFAGLILFRTSNSMDSISCFHNAQSIEPNRSKILMNEAAAYENCNLSQEAKMIYKEIKESDPMYYYAKSRLLYLHSPHSKNDNALNPQVFDLTINELFSNPSEIAIQKFLDCPLFLSEVTMNFIKAPPCFSIVHQNVSYFRTDIE